MAWAVEIRAAQVLELIQTGLAVQPFTLGGASKDWPIFFN